MRQTRSPRLSDLQPCQPFRISFNAQPPYPERNSPYQAYQFKSSISKIYEAPDPYHPTYRSCTSSCSGATSGDPRHILRFILRFLLILRTFCDHAPVFKMERRKFRQTLPNLAMTFSARSKQTVHSTLRICNIDPNACMYQTMQ
jgi:hypothetical protein